MLRRIQRAKEFYDDYPQGRPINAPMLRYVAQLAKGFGKWADLRFLEAPRIFRQRTLRLLFFQQHRH